MARRNVNNNLMYCCVREQRRDRKSKNIRNVTGEQATRRRDGAGRLIVIYCAFVPRWSDAKADVSTGPQTEQPIGCRINRRVSVVRSSRALQGDRVVYK